METTTLIAILVTILAVAAIGAIFVCGFLFGRKNGYAKGYDQAIRDLLLAKNPEAWEMARMLQIDLIEQLKTEKLKKIRIQEATTALERKSPT